MVRLCVCVFSVLMVCGPSMGQVAAPPERVAPAPTEKPTPIARARAEKPEGVAPSEVRASTPKVEVAGTGEKVDLRAKWTTGDTSKYEFEFTSRWTARMGEGEKPTKGGQLYRQNGRMVRRVLAVDDGGVTLALTMEQLHVQVSSGTEVVHYDSDFGDNPERVNVLTELVNLCVGRQIIVKLDRAGEIVSVTGNESPPPDITKPDAPAKQLPQAILGTQVIRKLWRPLYGLEKKNLNSRVGDKWTSTDVTTDPALGTFELTIQHTLSAFKDGVAKIDSTADVMLTPVIGHGVMSATLKGSTVTGMVEWNASKGLLKTWETNQEMKLDTERSGEKQKLETVLSTSIKWIDPNAPKEVPKELAKDAAKDTPKDAAPETKKQ